MKTDDLIETLAADLPAARPRQVERRLLLALCAGGLLVLLGVGLWLGFREDLGAAMMGPTFWIKAAYTGALGLVGFWLLDRLGRPGSAIRAPLTALAIVMTAATGFAAWEVVSMPEAERMPAVMGESARVCAPLILILSLIAAPFVFGAAQGFAPMRPGAAGAAAGLLTAALATTLYGLHCPEHTASFVMVWYSLGIALAVAGGAAVGRVLFRW
ncbi:MAG: DUF1109 domain-containing protein [Brevundimonas sp.]|uniref:DUF1109 domain-containing protein n=1 Tax=Brevundimonas sp. TaxID=1871086 RepID=UPI002732B44B|nr:DUF1109 domain-containing protein [Brevundimonas sp.]MDP3405550.1 DUF1109 domain-containing protein [Brevundimonas sp.]